MDSWDAAVQLANSDSLTAGDPVSADTSELTSPTVIATLEDLEGNADDTVTIRIEGKVRTYPVEQRTLSGTGAEGTVTADVPQCERVELESSNGVTYSAEVRANA
jgi:hypothetical protein